MGNRLLALGIALTAILTAVSCVPAAAQLSLPYYSVGISGSNLYLFGVGTQWNGKSWALLHGFGTASLSDVATSADGHYVFVSDQRTGQEALHVFRIDSITTPTATLIGNPISLSGMSHPVITVTSSGSQVYVVDRGGTSYLWVSSGGDWANAPDPGPPVSIADSRMKDVAAYGTGDGAVVARWTQGRDPVVWPAQSTQVTNFSGGSQGATAEGNTNVNGMAIAPSAVATHRFGSGNEYAYVIDDGFRGEPAALTVFNASGPSLENTYLFPVGMRPETNDLPGTITAFTVGSQDYLCIVGTDGDIQQAWLFQLNDNGTLPFTVADGKQWLDVTKSYLFNADPNDHGSHRLAVSWDGEIVWVGVSSGVSGSVLALDSQSFTSSGAGDYYSRIVTEPTDPIRGIAGLYPYVPEPSSLAALSGLGLGAIGFVRFRRRRVTR